LDRFKGGRSLPDSNSENEIRLLRSSDFGSTWLPRQVLGRSHSGPIAVFGNEVFINVKDSSFLSRILRSSDNGETFALLPSVPSQLGTYQFEGFVASSSNLHGMLSLFHQSTGTFETYYYRSTDAGLIWEPPKILSTIDNYNANVWDLTVSGSDVYALWNDGKFGGVFSGTLLLRRSIDGGQTFLGEQILSPNTAVTYSLASEGNQFYIAWDTDEGGNESRSHTYIAKSLDRGVTFCQQGRVGNPLYSTTAPDIAIGSSIVLAGSWRDSGSYRYQVFFTRSFSTTSVVIGGGGSEAKFSVEEPYPNPFNGATMFRYSIPTDSYVKVDVIDVLGQQVRELENVFLHAGSTMLKWDGNDNYGRTVGSGIYFIRFSANKSVSLKKVLLLR